MLSKHSVNRMRSIKAEDGMAMSILSSDEEEEEERFDDDGDDDDEFDGSNGNDAD